VFQKSLCSVTVHKRNILINIHYESYPIVTAEFNLRGILSFPTIADLFNKTPQISTIFLLNYL
jgi:hypothetical protein